MRFMIITKANEESEAGVMPSSELIAAMGKFNEDMIAAGVLLAGEGLQSSAKGKRVALKDGKFVMLRIPYPMGFYAKGLDGRIDDPRAGWKGRGLWSTNGDRTPWLMETGKGSSPRAVHIQVWPDPLAQ